MVAATFVGRVGGLAAGLGIGLAVLQGAAVAAADSGSDSSASQASSSSSSPRAAAVAAPRRSAPSSLNRNNRSLSPVKLAPRAAATAAAVAAPDPKATATTVYGQIGKWMINKKGNVADWVGLPGGGNPAYGDKKVQEPINTIFVVKADSAKKAQKTLDKALKAADFGPSNWSSIGYSGIVKTDTYKQYPRGGLFGNNTGLIGLIAGVGPAYRDAPYNKPNTHLRTFGGASDGNGNFIFTASVSTEDLVKIDGKTTHALETDGFNGGRAALLTAMTGKGAKDLGKIEMGNAIPGDDPTYTTGGADGLAQVIGIGVA